MRWLGEVGGGRERECDAAVGTQLLSDTHMDTQKQHQLKCVCSSSVYISCSFSTPPSIMRLLGFFLHTQTHNHAQMFTNDMQDIPAAVNQPLRNLLYVKKPWQLFFLHFSYTHSYIYMERDTQNLNIQPVWWSTPESDLTGSLTQHSAPCKAWTADQYIPV